MASQENSHLFISYATEDQMVARWLARKLASRGHPVWFDQMKMLGGEPWPQEIDDAIKRRTFRMLALISRHSLQKQKPTGERTLAQRISEQRKIPDFLIPLKLDNGELDWLTTTISYISFLSGWADGWRALTKKLDSISAPRSLSNASPLAASTFPRGDDLIGNSGEALFTNVIQVKSFPEVIKVFQFTNELNRNEREALDESWAYHEIESNQFAALVPPPLEFSNSIKPTKEQLLWTAFDFVRKIPSRHLAATLLLKSLSRRLSKAGCLRHPNPKRQDTFYLPSTFTEDGKLHFKSYTGKKTWLQIKGQVTFRRGVSREINFHHFAFRIQLARGLGRELFVQLTPSLVFFDQAGNPITDKSAGSRRRKLTKMWWNNKWTNRLLAAEQILTKLPPSGEGDLVMEPGLFLLSSPRNLNEMLLKSEEAESHEENQENELAGEIELDEPSPEATDE